MIYQCYFAEGQQSSIFKSALYEGFGLEPEVNASITDNCPELEDPRVRMYLTEYAAMLHLWRNPHKIKDDWIGFTSYRQLDKFPTILQPDDLEAIKTSLQESDILGWGFYKLLDTFTQEDVTPAFLSECCHPGIMNYAQTVMEQFQEKIPKSFSETSIELFANYWIMSVENFNLYMEWSFPKIKWMLDNCDEFDYTKKHPKAIGYVMERLHIFWYRINNKKTKNIGTLSHLFIADPTVVKNLHNMS
mgnify:CR=1 FL=1